MSRDRYVSTQPPVNPRDLTEYLSYELHRVENALRQLFPQYEVSFIDQTAVASEAGIIIADASGTAVVVTLPGASVSEGDQYRVVKQKGSNNVIVRSSETINGSGSATLSAQYQTGLFISDGNEWFKI